MADNDLKKSSTSSNNFNTIVLFVYNYWISHRKLADIHVVYESYPEQFGSLRDVSILFDDVKFKTAVLELGVPWVRKRRGLSEQQSFAINYILNPTERGNLETKLKRIGVPYTTWTAWLKQPEFASVYHSTASSSLADAMPFIQNALVHRAEKGDMTAIKFAYEVSGKYNPNDRNTTDIQVVLAAVVDIITRNVTDPLVLSKMGAELQLMASRVPGLNRNLVDDSYSREPEPVNREQEPVIIREIENGNSDS